ncbi:MAG: AraC family transcriptional regulator [Hespellia sp.]|nr:AraC family transcriptional regulator [Hespellia sp.]
MQSVMENWNGQIVEPYGFSPCEDHPYGPLGRCWKLSSEIGEGLYWAYGEKDLYDIKIHDFYYHKDTLINCEVSGYLSIFYYSSISGEQLNPYRRMDAGCIQSIAGGDEPYKMWVHKKIPVRCIGVGITPAYYEQHMKENYPEEYINPYAAFAKLDQEEVFPELVILLKQIENYRSEGIAAKLFYKAKVDELVSLLLSRLMNHPEQNRNAEVSKQDVKQLEVATAYLNDHYASDISLEQLAQFACMSVSKFKNVFKRYYGCSVTSYIQQRRLSHAECLLAESDLTIGQIAESVGYSTSSRLSLLLRESTGLTPVEYRKMAQRK